MTPLELNDLAKYSPWVIKLIGNNSIEYIKNNEQIYREFGLEKWGNLLSKWNKSPCSIDDMRRIEVPDEAIFPALINNNLNAISAIEAQIIYIEIIEKQLKEFNVSNLVEIGCGYGGIILKILEKGLVSLNSTVGIEYTKEGTELAEKIAKFSNLNASIYQGDFNNLNSLDMKIFRGKDILTSYSFHYVKDDVNCIQNIINLKPRIVIQFEPVFQHFQENEILGLLQKKYMKVNDYNLNFRNQLEFLKNNGEIEIIKEVPLIFGINCLLPASLLVWKVI